MATQTLDKRVAELEKRVAELENKQGHSRRAKSNRRLKSLCRALQREGSAAKIRDLKRSLRHEFYYGDQAP